MPSIVQRYPSLEKIETDDSIIIQDTPPKRTSSMTDLTAGFLNPIVLTPHSTATSCSDRVNRRFSTVDLTEDTSDDECQIVSVEEKVNQYSEMIKNCKYLSTDFMDQMNSRDWKIERQRKQIEHLELTLEFWEKQRIKAREIEMKSIEKTFASMLSQGPVLIDPYLEPQPVTEGLPYKRSIFKSAVQIPVLSEEQWVRVEKLVSTAVNEGILVDKLRLSLTGKDLCSLLPGQWLTDMIINFYLQLIHHRSIQKTDNLCPVAVMSTFFFPKLLSGGFEAVKRWTRRNDLFKHDIIFFPIHERGNHWCLAVAHLINKTLTYYDSMGSSNHSCLSKLFSYIKLEYKSKRNVELPDEDQWQFYNPQKESPQQNNINDCGVFALTTAEFLSRGQDLVFQQQDIPGIRQRMMYEILFQKLLTTQTDLSHLE